MKSVEIVPLENNKKNLKKFVKFAWEIYRDDNYWVPPLIMDQVNYIHHGPYHDTGIIQPFMAFRDGKPVGRLIAHYDTYHNEYFGVKRGCVGFFECINDIEVSRALFWAAEQWLSEHGMEVIFGPLNFLVYDASGLLVNHFDDDPVLECVYNPPYYLDLFSDYGFEKVVDWYAYRFHRDSQIPKTLYKIRDRVLNNKEGITFRDINPKKYDEETGKMLEIFNKAWENNWGHLPISEKQFSFFAHEVKMIVKPELIIIAEHKGKPIGYVLSIPDINQAIKRANGKLLPFGLIKMLLGMRHVTRIKTFMLGVLPEYRRKGLDILFYVETLERGKKMGYIESDCSVIVENNKNMIDAVEHFGAKRDKTFRHFSKPIEQL